MTRAQPRMRRIAAKRRAERMTIADAMKAQRTDQQMQIDCIDVIAEFARRDTARKQIFYRVNDRDVAAFKALHLLDILRAVNVFYRHEAHEVALAVVIVEREFDQRAHA